MSTLKLNSIPADVFSAKDTQDVKVNANGVTLSRENIVATGRLAACEYIGMRLNENKTNLVKYQSRLAGQDMDYATLSKMHQDQKFLFCATKAYEENGKAAPTLEEAKRDYGLSRNSTFLRVMASIDRDVITPLFFRVLDDVSMNGLMNWESVALGSTKEITIRSNDAILFEDSAFGSGSSATKNYLYAQTITINPKPKQANVVIKWFQDIINGDAGDYYAAIIRGMYNKIYAKFVDALTTAAGNTKYMPSALKAASYTTPNWLTITTNVAAANGLRRRDLIAFGAVQALNEVVPVDGQGGAILGMQYGLGEKWFSNGFIPNVGGVDLFEVDPAIVPGTQNSTLQMIFPTNKIYIAAKAGEGYAPLQGCYAEGTPINIELGINQTADYTIDMKVTALFDIAPIFASKVGEITI